MRIKAQLKELLCFFACFQCVASKHSSQRVRRESVDALGRSQSFKSILPPAVGKIKRQSSSVLLPSNESLLNARTHANHLTSTVLEQASAGGGEETPARGSPLASRTISLTSTAQRHHTETRPKTHCHAPHASSGHHCKEGATIAVGEKCTLECVGKFEGQRPNPSQDMCSMTSAGVPEFPPKKNWHCNDATCTADISSKVRCYNKSFIKHNERCNLECIDKALEPGPGNGSLLCTCKKDGPSLQCRYHPLVESITIECKTCEDWKADDHYEGNHCSEPESSSDLFLVLVVLCIMVVVPGCIGLYCLYKVVKYCFFGGKSSGSEEQGFTPFSSR